MTAMTDTWRHVREMLQSYCETWRCEGWAHSTAYVDLAVISRVEIKVWLYVCFWVLALTLLKQRSCLNVRSTCLICSCHAGQHCRKLQRSAKLKYHLNARVIYRSVFECVSPLWGLCWLFHLSRKPLSLHWGQNWQERKLLCLVFFPANPWQKYWDLLIYIVGRGG